MTTQGRHWHRRKVFRHAEILAAASEEVVECGYAAATMESIAARAGITKGTIYLYFASKDALLGVLRAESGHSTPGDDPKQETVLLPHR